MNYMMFDCDSFERDILAGVKGSTFRARHVGKAARYKVGELLSAKRWSGRPYDSKQRTFAFIRILEAQMFEFYSGRFFRLEKTPMFEALLQTEIDTALLAQTEGLSPDALVERFSKEQKNGKPLLLWFYRFTLLRAAVSAKPPYQGGAEL